MPNVRLKNGQLIVDPGGDPAASTPAGYAPTAGNGGFVQSGNILVSTQNAGWRQLVITRGGAHP